MQYTQIRCLNLHEYQSKALMQKYGIAVQKFEVADDASAATQKARDLGTFPAYRYLMYLTAARCA